MLDSTKNSEAFESPLDKFLMASLYLRYNGALAGDGGGGGGGGGAGGGGGGGGLK
jgi:hypothetical protein